MNTAANLTAIYGDQRPVDELSLDVRPGRFVRLVTGSVRSLRRLVQARRTPAS